MKISEKIDLLINEVKTMQISKELTKAQQYYKFIELSGDLKRAKAKAIKVEALSTDENNLKPIEHHSV